MPSRLLCCLVFVLASNSDSIRSLGKARYSIFVLGTLHTRRLYLAQTRNLILYFGLWHRITTAFAPYVRSKKFQVFRAKHTGDLLMSCGMDAWILHGRAFNSSLSVRQCSLPVTPESAARRMAVSNASKTSPWYGSAVIRRHNQAACFAFEAACWASVKAVSYVSPAGTEETHLSS